MRRVARNPEGPEDRRARAMYERVLAGWVCDLLIAPPRALWRRPDPIGDYRNRNWRLLYRGSVLDD